MTQRRPNPYFVRAYGTSAQGMHPLAGYAAKELKLKRLMTLADFAFGHEQMAGFQRIFEEAGGRIVKKLWPPLVTPDYTPYLAQIGGIDAIFQGFGGWNPLKFMKQYKDQGLKLPVLGGSTACDDALLTSFDDEAVGMISSSIYSNDLDTPSNKELIERPDEQLDVGELARDGVDDRGLLAREVDEHLFPGAVNLAHRGRERPRPALVVPAKLAVALSVGLPFEILELPTQQRHPRAA